MLKNLFFLACLVLICFVLPLNSFAFTDRFSTLYYVPATAPEDFITTVGSSTLNQRQFRLSTFLDYNYHPLELSVGGIRVRGIMEHLAVANFGVAYGLASFWEAEAILPVVGLNRFDPPIAGSTGMKNKFGIGDLFLRSRFKLLDKKTNFIGLSLVPFLTIPTGNEGNFVSDKRPTGGGVVAIDRDFGKYFSMGINLGAKLRQQIIFQDYDTKTLGLASLALRANASKYVSITTEVMSQTTLTRPFRDQVTSPVEVLGQIGYQIPQTNINLSLGGGYALIRGAGLPQFRGNLGISYTGNIRKFKIHQQFTRTIYFDPGKSTITTEGAVSLGEVAREFKSNKDAKKIILSAHADTEGSKEYNQKISEERVAATINLLISYHGIDPEKILSEAHGEDVLIISPQDENDENRKLNRRVEIEIIYE